MSIVRTGIYVIYGLSGLKGSTVENRRGLSESCLKLTNRSQTAAGWMGSGEKCGYFRKTLGLRIIRAILNVPRLMF